MAGQRTNHIPHLLPVKELEKRLRERPPGRTPKHLKRLDIGGFPSVVEKTSAIPEVKEEFYFRKWIHRTNNSDLALVTLPNDSNLKVLKIYKREDTFFVERAAYARLNHFKEITHGVTLECYGYSNVTPKSFPRWDPPTFYGNEEYDYRTGTNEQDRDQSLPTLRATYCWDNPADNMMKKYGVDFRCPHESWYWVLDNSQFGSDGQWLPTGDNLSHKRKALLLEYLPDAKRWDSTEYSEELAIRALAGAQIIQHALVRHGDQEERNLLVTGNRTVWIDFDIADVLDKMTDESLIRFKKDLIEVYLMLFVFPQNPK